MAAPSTTVARRLVAAVAALLLTAAAAGCGGATPGAAPAPGGAGASVDGTAAAGAAEGSFLRKEDLPQVAGLTWQQADEVPPSEGCFEPFTQRENFEPRLFTSDREPSVRQVIGTVDNVELGSSAVREGTTRIDDCLSPDTLTENGTKLLGAVQTAPVSGGDEGKIWHFDSTCADVDCGLDSATIAVGRVGTAVMHVVIGAAPDTISREDREATVRRAFERMAERGR